MLKDSKIQIVRPIIPSIKTLTKETHNKLNNSIIHAF